ncbi:hypothetical protein GGR57DRAFT_156306 [Xylariaceae sp. FL1272]|nr:hypothetical protein GGR57DRAFT_156306 [Xylariaceae sp. FL1272]
MDDEKSSRASAEPTPTSSKHGQKHSAPLGSGAGAGSATAGDATSAQSSKRRRGLGVVTPNACTECRKKRAKCDGHKPCGRCKAQKDVECVYEVPVRQSKENLRHEIENLRKSQQHSDSVFSALLQPELWEDVLHRLRNGQSIEGISDWLGGTLPSGGGAIPRFGPPGDHRGSLTLPSSMATFGGPPAGAGGYPAGAPGMNQPPGPNLKHDFDAHSPWNFSSQSQSVSQRSNSQNLEDMQWTSEGPPRSRVGLWLQDQSTDNVRYRGVDQVLAPLQSPDMKVPASTWTSISNDSALVQHLLALYFCWEYPTFASLSKEHFLKDYKHGRPRYCSPILVNALLALGCRFSTQPSTRANPDDPRTSGDHFFKEALRLLYRENDHHTLTTIQALGIMSIREASCGRDSESWYYAGQSVRLAIEMGLHRLSDAGDEDELAVQSATFWGAFALDHAWSLATGCLPQCSCFPHLPPKPSIIGDVEASLWVPYTDDGAPLQRSCEQPSNVRSVYKCFCELSELVHQSLYVLHSPGKPVTSRDLLSIYTQYLNWYDSIPEVLRLGHNFTPAVLFAHMYYHFAILLLFRPLIKLRIIGSSILPRDVCSQAADAIQGLTRSYSQLYTLHRTPSFVPYFVLTSSIMHLAVGANTGPTSPAAASTSSTVRPITKGGSSADAPREGEPDSSPGRQSAGGLSSKAIDSIKQGITDLAEMAPCHHFAEQALNILRYLAKQWNINVDVPHRGTGTVEDANKLVKPTTGSLNFFAPDVCAEDFVCSWGSQGQVQEMRERVSDLPPNDDADVEKMEGIISDEKARVTREANSTPHVGASITPAQSLENPLFWPFPMQGRPMLPDGDNLEDAGFAPL